MEYETDGIGWPLIDAYGDASFDCGKWQDEPGSVPYSEVLLKAQMARETLNSAIKGLKRRYDEDLYKCYSNEQEILECGEKLCNELAGIMGAYELRAMLGNTNFAILFERWEALKTAIKSHKGQTL